MNVLGTVVIFLGVSCLLLLILECLRGHSTWGWAKTRGLVTGSEIKVRVGPSGSDGVDSVVSPEIKYEYSYEGVDYVGSRVVFLSSFGRLDLAKTLVLRFSRGSQPTVYVNPEAPGESVLIQGFNMGFAVTGSLIIVVLSGVVFLAVSGG